MYTAVNGAVFAVVFVAEVNSARTFSEFCHVDCVFDKLGDTLFFGRRYWNNRHSEHLLQFVYHNRSAVLANLVHHIERNNHRNFQLHKLHCEIEISLHIGCVQNIDYAFWSVFEQKFACNVLLARIRREAVYSRKVGNQRILNTLYNSVFSVHGHTGKVAHVLIGTCQNVKESRFSTVLITCKRKGDDLVVR